MRGVKVELRDVRVGYRDVEALRGVSLVVQPSEFLALLGPSGCGKTTLLRAVAGLAEYDGSVLIDDRVVDDVPTHRRGIGMVFQDYALFPHKTVRENIAFGLAMQRVPADRAGARVREMVRLLKLEGLEQRYPQQLSGGQQQRVALARAIAVDPAVLLLDEPLGALDKKLREEMQVELRQLQKRVGITTLFVTHDQEEALALADRIAVMNHGRLEQVGTPAQVYEMPANRFVADFIGRSNVIPVTVLRREQDRYLCRVGERDTVSVPAASALEAGRRLFLSARPERLRITADRTSAAANALAGIVEHVTYLGMITQVRVRLDTGDTVSVVETPAASNGRPVPREIGQRVLVSWDFADAVLVGE